MNTSVSLANRCIVLLALATATVTGPGWPAQSGAAPATEARRAVIVGIDRHAAPTRDNVGAVGDAVDLRDALVRRGWRGDDIRMLTDHQATAAAIRDGFGWLAESTSDDTLSIFHFSGHVKQIDGDPDRDGEALDEFLWSADNHYIGDAELAAAMRAIRGRVWVDIAGCEAAGLDDGIAGPLRLVTAASQETEKGYEHPEWRNSIFTGLMVDHGLLHGSGDEDGDGRISLQEAWKLSAREAPNLTAGQRYGPQHPYLAGGDTSPWFLEAAPPPASPPQHETPPPEEPPPPSNCPAGLCIPGSAADTR